MKYIIGLDEVGRGSLAGPVVVAAFGAPPGSRIRHPRLGRAKDSKQLSPRARQEWSDYISANPKFTYAIAQISPQKIDSTNISRAANHAAGLAFRSLCRKLKIKPQDADIYLDGGLYIDKKGKMPHAKTAPKSDMNVPVVAAASIVAKVFRDKLMVNLADKYPGYGHEVHKGYGTRRHLNALIKYGPSDIHRLTFLGKSSIMKQNRHK